MLGMCPYIHLILPGVMKLRDLLAWSFQQSNKSSYCFFLELIEECRKRGRQEGKEGRRKQINLEHFLVLHLWQDAFTQTQILLVTGKDKLTTGVIKRS